MEETRFERDLTALAVVSVPSCSSPAVTAALTKTLLLLPLLLGRSSPGSAVAFTGAEAACGLPSPKMVGLLRLPVPTCTELVSHSAAAT